MLKFLKPKNIGSLTSILLVLIKKKECICNMQFATCNLQHAIYNMQFTTCNLQHPICKMQFATSTMHVIYQDQKIVQQVFGGTKKMSEIF